MLEESVKTAAVEAAKTAGEKVAEVAFNTALAVAQTAVYLVGAYALTRLGGRVVDGAFKAYDDRKKEEAAKA